MEFLTLEYANQLINSCIEKVNSDIGRPISIAITDKYGDLIAFSRMDGAPVRSIVIAQRKAYTAARAGISTEALLARIHREKIEISYFCDPLFTALPGGCLLKDQHNTVIGSIGVSGLAPLEDHRVAEFIANLVHTANL